MAVRKRCAPRGRQGDFCARVLELLNAYPDQEFSCSEIAREVGTRDPHSIIFLTLLVVKGKVQCVARQGRFYYVKA